MASDECCDFVDNVISISYMWKYLKPTLMFDLGRCFGYHIIRRIESVQGL